MEITLNSLVAIPPISPLDNSFFSNPSLVILPNLISSNTLIPFLWRFLDYLVVPR